MAGGEFKPVTINTQEEMDNLFRERLAREAKKYESYTSPEDLAGIKAGYDKQIKDLSDKAAAEREKYAGFDAQIRERDEKIAKYEADSVKTRIVIAAGLDPKYASRLVGKDEKEWKADAEALAKDFAAAHVPPLAQTEPAQGSGSGPAAEAFKEWFEGNFNS
ncbi:MAG: hypothetical protein IJU67_00865 [Lachnospiraceae bacterium]|nr:hypothetical protein [Lachnospiraceae bacterium]